VDILNVWGRLVFAEKEPLEAENLGLCRSQLRAEAMPVESKSFLQKKRKKCEKVLRLYGALGSQPSGKQKLCHGARIGGSSLYQNTTGEDPPAIFGKKEDD